MAVHDFSTTGVVSRLPLTRLLPALAAALLGVTILLGVGFAQQEQVHNAAHDTRHAFAFPCH
jgi:cobalt transporter subunit CbtB